MRGGEWLAGLAMAALALSQLVMSSCGAKKGSLMLAVSTDMKTPKDVNLVSVTVLSNNNVKYYRGPRDAGGGDQAAGDARDRRVRRPEGLDADPRHPADGEGTSAGDGLDLATCSLARGARDPSRLNLALETPDTGECVATGRCLIPLDKGERGWREDGADLRLAASICKRIREGGARLVEASGACTPKEESNPVCTVDAPEVRPSGDAQVQVSPTLASIEDFPTSLTTQPSGLGGLLFVSATRIAALDTSASPPSVRDVLAFDPSQPGPRHIATTEYGSVVASSSSDSSYLVTPQSTLDRKIRSSPRTPTGVALDGGVYLFDGGGIFIDPPFDPNSQLAAYDPPITSLLGLTARSGYDFLVTGHRNLFDDKVKRISVSGINPAVDSTKCPLYSGPPFKVAGCIDAMIADPNDAYAIYVLAAGVGVFRSRVEVGVDGGASVNVGGPEPPLDPSAATDVEGYDPNGDYYPRGLTAAGRCIVYTGKSAIHYSAPGNSARSIALPAGFVALGVALLLAPGTDRGWPI